MAIKLDLGLVRTTVDIGPKARERGQRSLSKGRPTCQIALMATGKKDDDREAELEAANSKPTQREL